MIDYKIPMMNDSLLQLKTTILYATFCGNRSKTSIGAFNWFPRSVSANSCIVSCGLYREKEGFGEWFELKQSIWIGLCVFIIS